MEEEERVLETFLSLKHENSSYELKRINGGHYVYLSSGRRDAAGRIRKISIYKGKITSDGTFVEIKRKKGSVLKAQAEQKESRRLPVEVVLNDLTYDTETGVRLNSLKYEKKLLTALSMNGRISLPALSRMLGLSINATNWQVRSLEKRHGIRYMPEIDVEKFGYLPFLFTVRFPSGMPPIDKLKEILAGEPRVQLAMLTKGEFDLLIYALVQRAGDTASLIASLCDKLVSHDCIFHAIPIHEDYGFVPLRDEFIDLLKEKGVLLDREYAVIRELNKNGVVEFSAIDERYGFDKGRSSYSYYKLKNEGKIKRITMTLNKLPMRYIGIIHENVISWSKFKAGRHASLANVVTDHDKTPINKYIAVYDTTSPLGSIFFLPVFDNDDLNGTVDEIEKLGLGVRLSTTIVSNVIVGDFCYRKFDNTHSIQQHILETEYGSERVRRIDYEETGRRKVRAENILDPHGAKVAKETALDFSSTLP